VKKKINWSAFRNHFKRTSDQKRRYEFVFKNESGKLLVFRSESYCGIGLGREDYGLKKSEMKAFLIMMCHRHKLVIDASSVTRTGQLISHRRHDYRIVFVDLESGHPIPRGILEEPAVRKKWLVSHLPLYEETAAA
jgi:hypothetical protein